MSPTSCWRKIWTIWRRPADTDDTWKAFVGVKGNKMDAYRAMELCERLANDVQYEYQAMQGDERPAQYQRRFRA